MQEVAIPWKLLTADGSAPPVGSEVRIAVEPNFTAGPFGGMDPAGHTAIFGRPLLTCSSIASTGPPVNSFYPHWLKAQRPRQLANPAEF